ncbi:helix-turn-helix domain-containing protein [Maridesulfovibrio bastinii]|uniref:helix-turn-helix domain-containing protein n=1 Tax=Maridesulfovibrio bastinii TaxID=47157 RepID=UPI0003F4AE97|nr:helix-turn-helix domain-containing protein [Maridesulfovibrio bastinii]
MIAQKKYGFDPDYAVPPGVTLLEVQESLGMSQKDFALRLGMTVQSLNRIIKDRQPITYETANKLELVTGVAAGFWNKLESNYRERVAKLEAKKQREADIDWLKTIPVKELADRGFIKLTKNKVDNLHEVLRFYGVASVSAWKDFWLTPAVAARRSSCFDSQPGPASAWIRQGELQALEIHCSPYNRQLFIENLQKIRCLTTLDADFVHKLKELCADAGVAVALVPEMKKVPWNGATKWLTKDKAMILLSLRGKGEDIFWFSFFHEASHVLHDSKKDMLINSNENRDDDPQEKRADEFAADFLIPKKYNLKIRRARSKDNIIVLAKNLGISPGIVAGRYCHLTGNWGQFRGLIRKFQWK